MSMSYVSLHKENSITGGRSISGSWTTDNADYEGFIRNTKDNAFCEFNLIVFRKGGDLMGEQYFGVDVELHGGKG